MPYSLIVYDELDPSPALIFEMHLGPAWLMMTYWITPAERIGLPLVIDMLGRADTEEGFALKGLELIAFAKEVSRLRDFWLQPNARIFDGEHEVAAPDYFDKKLSKIQTASLQAYDNGHTLSVC